MLKKILIGLGVLATAVVVTVVSMQSSEEWSVGEVVRTPDSQFENLPDYDFQPNYVDVSGYRIHYVDEGPRDGEVVLLMHGQPSWSYLYRHMIPLLSEAGYRVIAPDNVGFGKSDKPVNWSDHSYQMHVDVMTSFVDAIEIEGATLFAQDWGGLIGLRVVEQRPDRFSRIMLSNTTLPAAGGIQGWLGYPLFRMGVWNEGDVQQLDFDGEEFSFTTWVAYARTSNEFDFSVLFQNGTTRQLSDAELAGYAAPFPTEETMAGVRMFPTLVASQLRQNQVILDEFYANWDKPLMTAFGTDDGLMAGLDKDWQERVPGAKEQTHTLVEGGAHFIQEDKPKKLVELLDQFIKRN
ncbi:MAG: haloalkane dehalogenase [Parasphingorhabdus sp.]